MQKNKAASVEFRSVSKRYGVVTAVRDVSFTAAPGTLTTLLGPSGCGKTTTLRMIAGLELASAGKIMIGDRDVTHLSASDRDVSMVFQSYALFPHMTVIENVSYGLRVGGMRKTDAYERARETLALVGLRDFDKRLPSEMSGGQQQRVAVARALVLEPQVLLFDEPLSNLDAKLRRKVREDIRDLQQRLGLTVVYVTHDQEEALAVSDQIIVMSNAQIAQVGSPQDLYENPVNLFVADFIGDANIVDARIERRDGAMAEVRFDTILARLATDLPQGPVKLAIRPEALRLDAPGAQQGMAGSVLKAAYLGGHMEYTIETAAGALFIKDRDMTRRFAVGQAVSLTFGRTGIAVLAPE